MGSDLGGLDEITTAKTAILCRAAALIAWLEAQEAAFAGDGKLDIAAYTTATNTLRRLLADIGLERSARNLTPTLAEYARMREAG